MQEARGRCATLFLVVNSAHTAANMRVTTYLAHGYRGWTRTGRKCQLPGARVTLHLEVIGNQGRHAHSIIVNAFNKMHGGTL